MKRVPFAIITTIAHNVGDDFVREGILYLLDRLGVLGDAEFIHKHSPVTSVFGFEGLRSRRLSKAVEPITRTLKLRDRVSEGSVLVQSGAPVYWCHANGPHCADNEWFDPLVRKRFLPSRRERKFLSVAGGSCQRYHSDGSEIDRCEKCRSYIREFFDVCTLTLLRDPLARSMLRRAGRDADVLPCTSIFARDRFGLVPQKGEFIVINGMENGGHFTFGQTIDGARWQKLFAEIAAAASKRGRVVVACHSRREELMAKRIVPHLERFLVPNDHVEFMRFYSRARYGIVNRVHAGFMMASFGKPATVIGNDSRARMIEGLNNKCHFVGDLTSENVGDLLEAVERREHTYREESEYIRSEALKKYLGSIEAALP